MAQSETPESPRGLGERGILARRKSRQAGRFYSLTAASTILPGLGLIPSRRRTGVAILSGFVLTVLVVLGYAPGEGGDLLGHQRRREPASADDPHPRPDHRGGHLDLGHHRHRAGQPARVGGRPPQGRDGRLRCAGRAAGLRAGSPVGPVRRHPALADRQRLRPAPPRRGHRPG
uniref:Uncharacterized protein n=1 Tax=Janibacter limosus TaxID=53458 RepID=A0AC61U369_9MICO|nr:hypothetical protein [Janibacter limosus]